MANKYFLHKVSPLTVLITLFVLHLLQFFHPKIPLTNAKENDCIGCHTKYTPNIVKDWHASEMSKQTEKEITCATCHGNEHHTEIDYDKALTPTAATCEECHQERVKQFNSGKHSDAWTAISTMPVLANQPKDLIQGEKGCGGSHAIGREDGQCDSCHTRHRFSREEARRPEACLPCHMGFDHGQWEIWSSSKHGVIYRLDRESGRAPVCQTCHMPNGSHGVSTSWGYFALRQPEPDKEWETYRRSIFKGLNILDPDGKPRSWKERVEMGQLFTINLLEDWKKKREEMITICSKCHAANYAREEIKKCDNIVKQSDKVMSEAIEIVSALYREGYLKKAEDYPVFPDLVLFYEIPTSIEQKLSTMLMRHRMRAIQGAFHTNPEYTLWYGWAELKRGLTDIKREASIIRERATVPSSKK
ncbi:MAG: cytochrome C [Thermodesulfovibrionia bacterium]|nr:cytochrome C [Thermodesulfovibrionia bacterium]